MKIPFGQYLPDIPAFENPGLVIARNCYPHSSSYKSVPGPIVYSNALNAIAKGFISTRDKEGQAYSFAGDATQLYQLSNAVWNDVSGAAYTTAEDNGWEFAQWGNQIVATNYDDVIQAITFGDSAFAPLSGNPPKARHLAVVRDFLVLGNVTDTTAGGAAVPSQLHWSAFDNISLWTPSVSTQCDFQPLQSGGWIQKIIGGEYGIIIQERSIKRMTYVGSPIIFQFDEIEPEYGTPAVNSVVQKGHMIFYLGQDDFYMHAGGVSKPIGTDRVYSSFIYDLDEAYYRNIFAQVHPSLPLVFWAYPGAGSSNGACNRILVYNWVVDRWAGPIETNLELFGVFQAEGYSLDSLDNVSSSIDDLLYSLDSREWKGRTLNLAGFDTSHRLVTFTGDPLTATFETGDKQLTPGRRTLLTNIRPLVEGASASISLALSGRTKLPDSVSYDSSVVMNSEGECPVMNEGRYHRFRVTVADGFDHASGLVIEQAGPGGQY